MQQQQVYLLTVCESKAAMGKMASFLERHYQAWTSVLDVESDASPSFLGPLRGVELRDHSNAIGFELVQAPPIDRLDIEYHLALVRWVAIRVGRRRRKFGEDTLCQSVPFTKFMDLIEAVYIASDWKNPPPGPVVDALGVAIEPEYRQSMAWDYVKAPEMRRIGWTHFGKSEAETRKEILRVGMQPVTDLFKFIHNEIQRLDDLWKVAQ